MSIKLCHRIGPRVSPNFNTLEEIIKHDGLITFDGIYTCVYDNYKALKGKKVIFFVMGEQLGGDNTFDKGQPYSKYCTWEQILEMAEYLDAGIGYHSWSHKHCHLITDEAALRKEISPPEWLEELWNSKPADYPRMFAWPYGDYSDQAVTIAAEWYDKAYSVSQGDDSHPLKLKRSHLNW